MPSSSRIHTRTLSDAPWLGNHSCGTEPPCSSGLRQLPARDRSMAAAKTGETVMRLQLDSAKLAPRMMTAEDALLAFLAGSLGAKRERLLDFVRRPNARSKFLELLHHELGGLFEDGNVVRSLPAHAWQQTAFRFMPPHDFGLPVRSLRDAYTQQLTNELVVTGDGIYGYWRDETYVDAEVLVVASSPRLRP